MQIHALAVDYDGTLAHDGLMDEPSLKSLRDIIATGRCVILVTGRRLEPLQELIPDLSLFSLVVAENGALIYDPATREIELLCEAVPEEFVNRLTELGVSRLEAGRTIVATWRPFEAQCLQAVQELALDLQIIFNKDAVMVLPGGMNKAAGLQRALDKLGISPLNTVAVGDAENDLAMLRLAGCSAAVGNALDSVKEVADLVLEGMRGAGVRELIQLIIEDDFKSLAPSDKNRLKLGQTNDGPLLIPLFRESILVLGRSGGGKSKFGLAFLDELNRVGAQSIILDPEGDYQNVEHSLVLGTGNRAPDLEEVARMLEKNSGHFVVSMFRIPEEERPYYFDQLLHKISSTRGSQGRPHWLVVDEAHYVAPSQWQPAENWSRGQLLGTLLITAFPEKLSPAVIDSMNSFVFLADEPSEAVEECRKLLGLDVAMPVEIENENSQDYAEDLGLYWSRGQLEPRWFRRLKSASDSQRHKHSYYDGNMDPEYRFVFRGPDGKLNLEVQNLRLFMQIGQGVDDATWNHHLRKREYSHWFSDVIKSEELSALAAEVEERSDLSASESRELIFKQIRDMFEPKA